MKRRDALRAGGLTAASLLVPACAPPAPVPDRFAWGVASGDPTATSVLLWSRLVVFEPEEIEVDVFRDAAASDLVRTELGLADPERDGCIKVDVEGLAPGSTYYFRFRAAGSTSVLGRARTLPVGSLPRARLAVVTCSNFAFGHFHALRRIAERADLFAIVHLGDSIYEYADGVYGSLRPLDPPHELLTLDDYRRRYARYRTDPDLREALRQHALLVVWDDHEFANNAHVSGSLTHDWTTQGPWMDRVAAARRAFFEWMPVRDETRVHRSLALGDLARLVLLDTRMEGRDQPPIDEADWVRSDRRLVSEAQERWLTTELSRDDVFHTVVGNQVVLAPFPAQNNLDSWDGFPAQRARVLEAIAGAPSLPVVVTGDTHASLAFDLPGASYDASTQTGSLGVEWGAPALASPHLTGAEARAMEAALLAGTPHLRFTEQEAKGYLLLDLDHVRARGEWWHVADVSRADGGSETLVRALEARPERRASEPATMEPTSPIADAPALAPPEGGV